MAAARAIVSPARPAAIDETDESSMALNLSPEQLAEMRARGPGQAAARPAAPCSVWACNAQAVALFDGLATQWRVGPGGAYGLDYAVLPGVAQACGIPPRRAWRLLPDLQVMEAQALEVFAYEAEQPAQRSAHTVH